MPRHVDPVLAVQAGRQIRRRAVDGAAIDRAGRNLRIDQIHTHVVRVRSDEVTACSGRPADAGLGVDEHERSDDEPIRIAGRVRRRITGSARAGQRPELELHVGARPRVLRAAGKSTRFVSLMMPLAARTNLAEYVPENVLRGCRCGRDSSTAARQRGRGDCHDCDRRNGDREDDLLQEDSFLCRQST